MSITVLRPTHTRVAEWAERAVVTLTRRRCLSVDDARVIRAGIQAPYTQADPGYVHELVRTALQRLGQCAHDIAHPEPAYEDDTALEILAGLCPGLPATYQRRALWADLKDCAAELYDLGQDGPGGGRLRDPMSDVEYWARIGDLESDLDGYTRRALGGMSTGAGVRGSEGEADLTAPVPGHTPGGAA
jgi:hypothetical protein